MLVSVVVLINLLIAMMTDTYQRIQVIDGCACHALSRTALPLCFVCEAVKHQFFWAGPFIYFLFLFFVNDVLLHPILCQL